MRFSFLTTIIRLIALLALARRDQAKKRDLFFTRLVPQIVKRRFDLVGCLRPHRVPVPIVPGKGMPLGKVCSSGVSRPKNFEFRRQ